MAGLVVPDDKLKEKEQPQGNVALRGSDSAGTVYGDKGQTKKTESGQWTNLNQYKQANQGASEQMAESIKSNVEGDRDKLVTGINTTGQSNVGDITKAGDIASEKKDVYDAFKTPGGDYTTETEEWKKASGNAGWDDTYTHPSSISDSNYVQDNKAFQDRLTALRGKEGRQAELGRIQEATTTGGMKSLDNYLLGTTKVPDQILGDVSQTGGLVTDALTAQQEAEKAALDRLQGIDTSGDLSSVYTDTGDDITKNISILDNNKKLDRMKRGLPTPKQYRNARIDVERAQAKLDGIIAAGGKPGAGDIWGIYAKAAAKLHTAQTLFDVYDDAKTNYEKAMEDNPYVENALTPQQIIDAQAQQQAMAEILGQDYNPQSMNRFPTQEQEPQYAPSRDDQSRI